MQESKSIEINNIIFEFQGPLSPVAASIGCILKDKARVPFTEIRAFFCAKFRGIDRPGTKTSGKGVLSKRAKYVPYQGLQSFAKWFYLPSFSTLVLDIQKNMVDIQPS